eukprot:6584227-Pyramimonas_sp.AAC.1
MSRLPIRRCWPMFLQLNSSQHMPWEDPFGGGMFYGVPLAVLQMGFAYVIGFRLREVLTSPFAFPRQSFCHAANDR